MYGTVCMYVCGRIDNKADFDFLTLTLTNTGQLATLGESTSANSSRFDGSDVRL